MAASFTEENKKLLEKIVVACLKSSLATRPRQGEIGHYNKLMKGFQVILSISEETFNISCILYKGGYCNFRELNSTRPLTKLYWKIY